MSTYLCVLWSRAVCSLASGMALWMVVLGSWWVTMIQNMIFHQIEIELP